jgi:mannan endo-1,4-beta-mannosidase
VNPDWLIIGEGVDCVTGTGSPECGWWGGNLSGARQFPVRLSKPDKLVYSAHEYATSVFAQPWFSDPAFPANMPALWDHFFGYLEKENIAPVLLGEFGSTLRDSRDGVWLRELMSYSGTGTSGMDFTYWSWNPNSGDTGGILNDDWTTVNTAKQAYLDPYLIPPVAPGNGPPEAVPGFHVSAGRLYDANNNEFVMRGVNHAHTWYTSQTSSFANIKALGANTVRVVLSSGDRWTRNDTADVTNVVSLCRQNRLICVLEVHDTTGYGEQSGAVTLARAVDYWLGVQPALTGQEKYIIVNIGNEPYGNTGYSTWAADNTSAVQRLRSAGFAHTIMVDAPNWGQDWSFTMRDNAAAVFGADPARNTVFSIHMYGVFDTAAEINDYLGRFVSAGLPVLVGEFGGNHTDGDPDEDTIMATAQAQRLGYLGWSWSGNSSDVAYLDMSVSFSPTDLTPWGQRFFNGANGIKQTSKEASVYQETQAMAATRS